jgi:hypothetical protein
MLDRLFGWFVASLATVLFGVVIYRAIKPETTHGTYNAEGVAQEVIRASTPGEVALRVGMALATVLGCIAIAQSSRKAFFIARALFTIRVAVDLATIVTNPKDRFGAMALVFDLVLVGYCILRLRDPNLK